MHALVGKTPCSYGQNRKEQVVLTRCRIGHSRLTHSYLLNNEERPECIPCNSNFQHGTSVLFTSHPQDGLVVNSYIPHNRQTPLQAEEALGPISIIMRED
jgi:hypothetical protein